MWLLDSGDFRYISCCQEWFSEFEALDNESIYLGNDRNVKVEGLGKIFISPLLSRKWSDRSGVINHIMFRFQEKLVFCWCMHVKQASN